METGNYKKVADVIVAETALRSFAIPEDGGSPAQRVAALIRQQCAGWPALQQARQGLEQRCLRTVRLADTDVVLQCNPQRAKSATAAVDKASIEKRPCFLCPDNLYPLQKALLYQGDWLILNNPFPIFYDHLVVSHADHLPQRIETALPAMFAFVRDLDYRYSVFYNGPACGASAPDHLHFQACPAGELPLMAQLMRFNDTDSAAMQVSGSDAHGRGHWFVCELDRRALFVCRSAEPLLLVEQVRQVLSYLGQGCGSAQEPMVNVVIGGSPERMLAVVMPRKAHRPACYFAEGAGQLLVSPGAVDVGGLVILPRREDYESMTAEMVEQIFSEVCWGREVFSDFMMQA
ncbi:MAG: DUF4922 domain-containing protein [Deltaproteobacteria bacterium]|nr:DUF4922 domain-containing protein [Deltaproteobacteria bacterium]